MALIEASQEMYAYRIGMHHFLHQPRILISKAGRAAVAADVLYAAVDNELLMCVLTCEWGEFSTIK